MKYLNLVALGVVSWLWALPAHAANECPGTPYERTGATCADLGLDTNRAVCLPGRRFAILCDDARGGRVRTCSSGIRCDGAADRGGRRYDYRDDYRDDYAWRDPGRRYPGDVYGGRNDGAVYFNGDWRACQTLRFDRRGDPSGYCARGTFNRDCRGGCERY